LPDGVTCDQRNLADIQADELRGFDAVVFLAGLSNDPMADASPWANWQYNAALPAYVGYQARRAGVKRFVYASTCSVYGFLPNHPSTEEQCPACTFPYGLSKYHGEQSVLNLVAADFSVIALRKGTICGHSPRMRFDLIVNTMYRAAVTRGVINVQSPDLWRPILDIRSAADAYSLAVEASPGLSGVFNIADGNWTVGQVATEVRKLIPTARIEVADTIQQRGASMAALRNYIVDTTRAQETLGWTPRQNSIAGIVRSMMGRQYGDMHAARYSNIETWRSLTNGRRAA
jgi:nucleoside-diphosphate-sugar epimerase